MQKKFICSGRSSDGGGCHSEVRATLGRRTGEWKVSYVELEHVNCSGGVAKATGATLAPLAAEAIPNNPDMSGAELGRLYKKKVGLKSARRSVRRYKKAAVDGLQSADAGTIQQAPGYCSELVQRSPGSVATVEVRTQPRGYSLKTAVCASVRYGFVVRFDPRFWRCVCVCPGLCVGGVCV